MTTPSPFETVWTNRPDTTGEWTAQQRQVFNADGIIGNAHNEAEARAIANAHNAALAALHQDLKAALDRRAEAVQQLAAEQEAHEWTRRNANSYYEQLAAEQEAKEKEIAWGQAMLNDLTTQLAAEQPLVDLLNQVLSETVNTPTYPDGPCLNKETRDDIKAALAQVKEGK